MFSVMDQKIDGLDSRTGARDRAPDSGVAARCRDIALRTGDMVSSNSLRINNRRWRVQWHFVDEAGVMACGDGFSALILHDRASAHAEASNEPTAGNCRVS